MVTFDEYEAAFKLFCSNYFLINNSRTFFLLRGLYAVGGKIMFRNKRENRCWELLDEDGCFLAKTNTQIVRNLAHLLQDASADRISDIEEFSCALTKEVKNFLQVVSHPTLFNIYGLDSGMYYVTNGHNKFRNFYCNEIAFRKYVARWSDEEILTMIFYSKEARKAAIPVYAEGTQDYHSFDNCVKRFAEKDSRFRNIATLLSL